jgi:hypothetical protein
MSAPRDAVCRHCERAPAETPQGLCRPCHDRRGVRRLYRGRSADKGPLWDRHIRALARLARRRRPLGGISLAETL